MSSIQATIARIRAYAAFRNWTKSRFAIEAGLQDTTLRNFHDENWNPTADTLRALEAVIPVGFDPNAVPEAKAS